MHYCDLQRFCASGLDIIMLIMQHSKATIIKLSYAPSDAKVKLDINHAVSLSFSHAKAAWKLVVCEIKIGLVYSLEFSVGFCGGCTPSTISNRIGQLSMASI